MERELKGFLVAVLLFSTTLATQWAASAAKKPDVAGVYSIQGAKGAIVLTLQDEPENKVSGSFNGGDLKSTLKGFAEGDTGGVLGTMTDPNGQFMSYFRAFREGKQGVGLTMARVMADLMALRTTVIDNAVRDAMTAGATQLVILGGGFTVRASGRAHV